MNGDARKRGSPHSWFGVFPGGTDRLVLTVGRVLGSPADPASIEADVLAAVRSASDGATWPSEALAIAHARVLDSKATVEIIVAFFDTRGHSFVYAAAGGPTPVLAIPDSIVATLPASGGTDVVTSLPPGSLVALAIDAGRVADAMRSARLGTPSESTQNVLRRVREIRSPMPAEALVVLAVADETLQSFSYSFPAIPLAAPLVRASLRPFAAGVSLDENQTFALQTAVGEAVANAVEHAYRLRSPGVVRVSAEHGRQMLVVTVEDDGGWRPSQHWREERGRGFPLMRALVDGVEICSREKSTAVRLVLRLRSGAAKD
jgi:anti-sigma regulatory factor (Ser/Thr protein kinase)